MNLVEEKVRKGGANENNVTASGDECNHASEGIVNGIITCSQLRIQESKIEKCASKKHPEHIGLNLKHAHDAKHINTCAGSQKEEHRMSCFW